MYSLASLISDKTITEELREAYAPVLTEVDPEVARLVKAADKHVD